MKQIARSVVVIVVLAATSLLLSAPSAWAVPSYTNRYGVECSRCHTMWGALTGAGVQFRLSGYRAIGGRDLTPVSKDLEISNGLLTIPTTLPLSFITGVGFDYRSEKRQAADGTSKTSTGSSLALEDASIFLTAPLGKHLAGFIEFPMYETKAWEFTPTGPYEANNTAKSKNLKFDSVTPGFEVAKFFWNNLLGDSAPRDSVNVLAGITHPPLAYSPGKVRLSINQYPIYERRALDLISHKNVEDMLGVDTNENLFRLSEPQLLAEFMGMVVPGKEVTEVGKKETFWFEYHIGVTNASNINADNNSDKGFYGRYIMRWYGQSLGVFAFYTGDTYDNDLRSGGASIANGGIMSGQQFSNSSLRVGPDMTLSLAPFGVPVWLENQYMYNREGNPTGFNKEFKWQGGFHQLNWQISKKAIAYGRYDWVSGNTFDDTHTTMGGVTGTTLAKPREWDVVAGFQYLLLQNVKFAAEYRHHDFEDKASTPNISKLTDNGFTTRVMIGF
jgi:hypothetical protein